MGSAAVIDRLLHWQWPEGGWPREKRFFKIASVQMSGSDLFDWGGASKRKTNEWVTADALTVLQAAGRISL